jgi:hypothetical protein
MEGIQGDVGPVKIVDLVDDVEKARRPGKVNRHHFQGVY